MPYWARSIRRIGVRGIRHIGNYLYAFAYEELALIRHFSFPGYGVLVIVNGDSVSLVASTSAEGPIPPKTAEQKLARKSEVKAKSTLILAIPDEHLLKFHACKDAKSLWEAIKNRDQKPIKFKLKLYNVAFVSSDNSSSTKEIVNTAHGVFAASSKDQTSTASYVDDVFSFFSNQSNYLQLDNEDLEQINTDDLEEMDLK
nr:hypothetical protein [Tanacetum cinerariifolium]